MVGCAADVFALRYSLRFVITLMYNVCGRQTGAKCAQMPDTDTDDPAGLCLLAFVLAIFS